MINRSLNKRQSFFVRILISFSFFYFHTFILSGQSFFGTQQVISERDTEVFKPRDIFAADLVGDGDLDVLAASPFRFLLGS